MSLYYPSEKDIDVMLERHVDLVNMAASTRLVTTVNLSEVYKSAYDAYKKNFPQTAEDQAHEFARFIVEKVK